MRFSIYAGEHGGDALWTEIQPSVPIRDGLFNTILFGETAAPPDLFGQWESLWLEIALDADGDGFGPGDVFSPRTPLGAVPVALYARDAGSLGGMAAGDFAREVNVYTRADIDAQQEAQDAQIAEKADRIEVEASQAAQDALIAMKADEALVSAALGEKADASEILRWQAATSGPVQAEGNRGYIVNSADELSVTLPLSDSLNLGATVRVSGIGAGGWRIAQNSGQRIITEGLQIANEGQWLPRESDRNWIALASSGDGARLIAAEEGGLLYISTDSGVSWSPAENIRDWSSVATSADGARLVAAVVGGRLYTSADAGETWIPRESDRNWSALASSSDGEKLVAAVLGGQLYTSTDHGETWDPRENDQSWRAVASSADGTHLAAGVFGGHIYVSNDSGLNWNARESARNWTAVATSADGRKLVAGAFGDSLYTSTNAGLSWTPRERNRSWIAVASSSDGTKLVACEFGGQLYTSSDSGVTWAQMESNRTWRAVASSIDGTKLVAGVLPGQIYTFSTVITQSVVGETGGLAGGQYTAVELQYVGSDTFLPLSAAGNLEAF